MKKLPLYLAGALLLLTALGSRAALITYTISAPTNSWSGTIQVFDLNAPVLEPDPFTNTKVGTITADGYGGNFIPDFQSTKGELTWTLIPGGLNVDAGLYIYSFDLSSAVKSNATWIDLVNNGAYALYLHPDPSDGVNPDIFAMYFIDGVGSPYKALGGVGDSASVTFSSGAAVPEPGTWAAAALLAGGAAFVRWRKRCLADKSVARG